MRVELKNIHKRFGAVHANNDVSLIVESGTIHGLLGENGAGKSTLAKALTGYISHDSGEILFDGKPVDVHTPVDGIRCGVGMLYQEPLDFPPLTVLENFMVGAPNRSPRVAAQQFNELAKQFNFKLDVNETVSNLTVGERQQLEVLRLLSLGVRTLILDEPTTGISASQKDALFAAVRQLAKSGHSIILVSHKLEDVEELCDEVTVMRAGKVVGHLNLRAPNSTQQSVSQQIVGMMFGKELAPPIKPATRRDESGVRLTHVLLKDDRLDVEVPEFAAQRGEVIGLAGLEGSGQLLFLQACAGLFQPARGTLNITQSGNMLGKNYKQFLKAGVCYLPADRLKEGLVNGLTIQDHVALREEHPSLFVDRAATLKGAEQAITTFNIRGKPHTYVERLSGGNQQRTQLALVPRGVSLLLMEHPTRGLDIESTLWVWQQLIARCKQGATIIFASADLDEIMQYSDRIVVFSGGRMSNAIPASELDVDKLGQMIGGKF
jgi:simple sugar transport system ATP-binding protein